MRTGHADQIDHQRNGQNRSAAADQAEDEPDQHTRSGAEQILKGFEHHVAAPLWGIAFIVGVTSHSCPFSIARQ